MPTPASTAAHPASPAWQPDTLVELTGGEWLTPPPQSPVHGAAIDTRALKPGQAFFAFKGERVDGHDYAQHAAQAGAPLIIAERKVAARTNTAVLRVPDVRAALAAIAAEHRKHLKGKVIAVTGSNGKTTTTRLLHAALRARLSGTCSIKSFNNDLGLPLTLLNAAADDDFVICEAGTSGPGEIERLSAICTPDIAVITAVGRAHLEKLGSLEGVAREKASLAAHLREGGAIIAYAAAPHLLEALEEYNATITAYAFAADRVTVPHHRVRVIEAPVEGPTRFELDSQPFTVGLPGQHNALNAAAAILAARALEAGDDDIRTGLQRPETAEMRLAVRRARLPLGGRCTLINDAYNANPDSTLAALTTLAGCNPRRVAVLGDMLEQGTEADEAHHAVLRTALGAAEIVFAVGPLAAQAARQLKDPRLVPVDQPSDDACRLIAHAVNENDTVLLKGSRAVRLERVAEHLPNL